LETQRQVKLSTIHINPNNPRLIKDDRFKKLCKSIEEFPKMMKLRPIIVDADGMILGGNMRFKALRELKYKDIPDAWVKRADELTTEEKQRFIIEDNVPFGEWDWDQLANEWDAELLSEWGVDIPDVTFGGEAEEDDYEIPDEIKTDIVLGDLFEIGQHRLLCGDSTDSDSVLRLTNGEVLDIYFTSPPYNAGTTPTEIKSGKKSKYENDADNKSDEAYHALLLTTTHLALQHCKYCFVNVQSIAGNKTVLIDYLFDMKKYYADTLIWQKQNAQPAMANNVLNSQFEYVHCFSQKANRAIGVRQFRGTLSNVIEISKQTKNEVISHNATFPIEFAGHFISNFTNSSVLDLFIGSGTTMVAAHQLNRMCYGMEIDPKYCQVIIDRMKKLDPDIVIKKNGVICDK
jgi:DNA modification methylase